MQAQTVMIVEDDSMLRELYSEIFAEVGFMVIAADNGANALKMLAALPTPELIITDLMMPRMDGVELILTLKADPRFALIPTLLISTKPDLALVATTLGVIGVDKVKFTNVVQKLTSTVRGIAC